VDCGTRDTPVPTNTAVAITREAKQFTGEIVKGLKDIGISLFFYVGRVLRGPKPELNKQTGLSQGALFNL